MKDKIVPCYYCVNYSSKSDKCILNDCYGYINEDKLLQYVLSNERYKNFTVIEPTVFKDLFDNKNLDIVQLFSIQPFSIDNDYEFDIVGFCGQCSWIDNKLNPLDDDSYSDNMIVYGYEYWEQDMYGKLLRGVDILVLNW